MMFLKPEILYYLIPWFIFVLFLVKVEVVKLNTKSADYGQALRSRRIMRAIIFITRLIAGSLLIVALAQPFTQVTKITPGNPELPVPPWWPRR